MDYWLVIRVEPSYRPFVVNLPFRSAGAADDAFGGAATGYGFKESVVVQADTRSEALAMAQKEIRRMDICEYGQDEGDIDTTPLTQLRKDD